MKLVKIALLAFAALGLAIWLVDAWAGARSARREAARREQTRAREEARLDDLRSRWDAVLEEARAAARSGALGEARRLALDLDRARPGDGAVRDLLAAATEPNVRLMNAARLACEGRVVEVIRSEPARWPAAVPAVVEGPRARVARALLESRDWFVTFGRGLDAEQRADLDEEVAQGQAADCASLDDTLRQSQERTFSVQQRLPPEVAPNGYLVVLDGAPTVILRTNGEAFSTTGLATLRLMQAPPVRLRGYEGLPVLAEVPQTMLENQARCRESAASRASAHADLVEGKQTKERLLSEAKERYARLCADEPPAPGASDAPGAPADPAAPAP